MIDSCARPPRNTITFDDDPLRNRPVRSGYQLLRHRRKNPFAEGSSLAAEDVGVCPHQIDGVCLPSGSLRAAVRKFRRIGEQVS